MKARISLPREEVEAFCRRWKIIEMALFGSVLREDFKPSSDIDVLVAFSADAGYDLFDLVHMQDELSAMFGRKVDLLTRRGLESSRNYLRKEEILTSAEVVYGP